MRFSILTPINNIKWIKPLYEGVKSQSFNDYEWVIVPNGEVLGSFSKDATDETILEIQRDPKVRILPMYGVNIPIGKLKLEAFNSAKGEILVELDHDDILHPDCLTKLDQAFNDPKIGFVYSNDAIVEDSSIFIPYSKSYGWTYHTELYKNKKVTVMDSYEPDAISFSIIYSMPDHVRSWRSSVYKKIGGHDKTLEILDDQDLLSRTYLNTEVKFINETLYYYRYHPSNSYKNYHSKISELAPKLQRKYLEKLIEREMELRKLPKYDLGGGICPKPGYTSVDLANSDIIMDLNEPWKFDSNSIGIINASNIFEHLKDPLHTMSELYRVLADGGYAFIEVPSTDGRGAFQDPTHVSFWNINSFDYYTKENENKFIRQYGYNILFQAIYLEDVQLHKNIIMTRCCLRAIKSDTRRPGYKELKWRDHE